MKSYLKKTVIANRMSALRFIVLISITLFAIKTNAQIGINTLAPDTTAALDIYPKANSGGKMGILIPRLGETTRLSMTVAGKGLMVYDTTNRMFYVNLTSGTPTWYAINPWVTSATASAPNAMYTNSTVTNVGIGTNTPTVRLDVNGSIKSNSVIATNTLTVPGFPSNALVPAGLISMFSGTLIPLGWGLCDGSSYTTSAGTIISPDLRGRFIVGSGTNVTPAVGDLNPNYTIGQTGGENNHVLSVPELPKHAHQASGDGATMTANGGNHSHSGGANGQGTGAQRAGGNSGGLANDSWGGISIDPNTHFHPNSDFAGKTGDGTTQGLNNQPHENRPPYYVLAYIIKLP